MEQPDNTTDRVNAAVEASIKIGAIFVMAMWCYQLSSPFVSLTVWAGIIAIAVKPLSDFIERKIGGSKSKAATLTTLILLAFFITPSVIMTERLVDNISAFSEHLKEGEIYVPKPKDEVKNWPVIGKKLYPVWDSASDDLEETLVRYRPQITELSQSATRAAAGAAGNMLLFMFSIILSGVFLASAKGIESFFHRLARRLAGNTGDEFATLTTATVRGVAQGIVGVALVQAIVAGLGFVVIGLPAAGVLAAVVLIMSIAHINPILLMAPLAIYVFSYASPLVATLYLIWSIAVGLMDNVLKPLVMGRGSKVPMLIIVVGAIGGLILKGISGLFTGAVVMAIGYQLFVVWLGTNDDKVADKSDSESSSD